MASPSRRFLLGAALSLGLAARAQAGGAGQAQSTQAGPRFGAALPLSGPYALSGDETLRGIQLAIDTINAQGGIAGKPVSLATADMPSQAAAAGVVNGLIKDAHAGILFGSGSSALSYPATAAAELAQIPFIELTAPADGIMTRGFKFLLRTGPSTSMTAQLAAATIRARFAGRRLGLLFNVGATDGAIAAATLAALKMAGLPLTLAAGYPEDASGLADQAGRMMRAKVEVLLHAAGADDALMAFQAMRELGWRPAALIGMGTGYAQRETQEALGAALDGAFVIAAPFYPGPAAAIAAAYEAKFAVQPRSAESCTAYVGAKLVFDTLRAAGEDPARLLAALRQVNLPKGALANGFGAAFDNAGQNSRSFVTLQNWKNGSLIPA